MNSESSVIFYFFICYFKKEDGESNGIVFIFLLIPLLEKVDQAPRISKPKNHVRHLQFKQKPWSPDELQIGRHKPPTRVMSRWHQHLCRGKKGGQLGSDGPEKMRILPCQEVFTGSVEALENKWKGFCRVQPGNECKETVQCVQHWLCSVGECGNGRWYGPSRDSKSSWN